ncbi:hypothetical protein GCM10009557_81900 [Virgisporangium ochraceum]|uniref:Uncharacterized protein n=1 Tax=Virgisporangium ochraceum TaxID=65505 RepID=A0A8J4E9I0_9ACTN|nr:hypothetical protein [Virgisporangium ochraceum]GIJ66761.1 hypothetical protein Voc01_016780 [Virgisporangium ochraceum]
MTDDTSAERSGMIAFGDLELGIRREVEVVRERFPDTDPAIVDGTVRELFAELRTDATVEAHLLAVTRNEAIRRLEEAGHTFRPADLAETTPDS